MSPNARQISPMTEAEDKEKFGKLFKNVLKPICVKVMMGYDSDSLKTLLDVISTHEDLPKRSNIRYAYFEYVFTPIHTILIHNDEIYTLGNNFSNQGGKISDNTESIKPFKKLKDMDKLYIIRILGCMIKRVNGFGGNMSNFTFIYRHMVFMMRGKNGIGIDLSSKDQKKIIYSEELILEALNTLTIVFDYIPISILILESFRADMGICISGCLSLLTESTSRAIKLKSIAVLNSILNAHKGSNEHLELLKSSLSFFIPGILSKVFRVLTGDFKQGRKVIIHSVSFWTEFICFLLSDKACSNLIFANSTNQGIEKVNPENALNMLEKLQKESFGNGNEKIEIKNNISNSVGGINKNNEKFSIERNSDWLKNTLKGLEPFMLKAFSSYNKTIKFNEDIQLAFINSSIELLKSCSNVFSYKISACLVEQLIFCSTSSSSFISDPAIEGLELFSEQLKFDKNNRNNLFEKLENLVNDLALICNESDEEKLIVNLSLLNGYMKILNGKLLNEWLILKFDILTPSLFHVLRFDSSDLIKMIEQKIHSSFDITKADKVFSRKSFISFSVKQKEILNLLKSLCIVLWENCTPEFLFDQFYGYLRSNEYRKQTVWILTEMIRGNKGNSNKGLRSTYYNFIQNIASEYLVEDIWNSSTMLYNEIVPDTYNFKKDKTRLDQANDLIIFQSLLLEGLSVCVSALSLLQVKLLLPKCFYPLLSKVGDRNIIISNDSLITLNIIAEKMRYSDTISFVVDNSDYFVDSVIYRLRYLDLYPETPLILLGCLRQLHAGRMVNLINDILEVVLSCLDSQLGKHRETFLSILEQILSILYLKANEFAGKRLDPPKEENIETENPFEQDEKEELREEDYDIRLSKLERTIVGEILERMQHYSQVKELSSRIIVLRIISLSVKVIQYWPVFLRPILHKVWVVIKHRINDPSLACVTEAVSTINVIYETMGEDFLANRFEDAWNYLKSQLEDNLFIVYFAKNSFSRNEMDLFTTILHLLDTICCNSPTLLIKYFEEIFVAILPFLIKKETGVSSRGNQRNQIFDLSLNLIQNLSFVDPDYHWLLLKMLKRNQISDFKPPSKMFPILQVPLIEANSFLYKFTLDPMKGLLAYSLDTIKN